MEYNFTKETVRILVTATIEYNANDKQSRKNAIKCAIENATSINTYGCETVIMNSAREVNR